jgi:hypothetical protein
MDSEIDVFEELAALLADVRREYPHWQENEIISQLRRSMPEYRQAIWRIAMPFSRGDSQLPDSYRERLSQLRQLAAGIEQVDLGHVFTSIDIRQSIDIVRDVYASWAGDLGTHVLANFTNQAELEVGSPDSLACLADLHGDIDGDNIANHMPKGRAVSAVLAYYRSDEAFMDGVTVHSRFRTFARDLGLLDDDGYVCTAEVHGRQILRNRTREFIEFDEIDLDGRGPLKLLSDLFDEEAQAKVNDLLDMAIEQFVAIIAAGVEGEWER